MPRQVAHRRYMGTLYFPTLNKRESWCEYMKDLNSRQVNDSTMKFFSAVKFFKCQPEICPLTERLHIQWYAELEKPLGFNEIQNLVEGDLKLKGHVEPCKGSQKQNVDYVSKQRSSAVAEFPELQHQIGEPCRQGARSDLNEAAADIVSGKRTLSDLIQDQPGLYVKYAKNWNDLSLQFSRPRQLGVKKVLWFYGPTGTGKTREAYEMCMQDGRDPFIWGPANGKWWDGYQHTAGLDCTIPVIMDEFRGDLKMGYMLQLLDRYRMKVEFKGGMCEFVSDQIIITSPKHPKDIYQDSSGDKIGQFLRRISEVHEFLEDGSRVITTSHFQDYQTMRLNNVVDGVPLPGFFS